MPCRCGDMSLGRCKALSKAPDMSNRDLDIMQDAAAGVEDSDADEDAANTGGRIRGWSESEDEEPEPEKRQPSSSPVRDNSVDCSLVMMNNCNTKQTKTILSSNMFILKLLFSCITLWNAF